MERARGGSDASYSRPDDPNPDRATLAAEAAVLRGGGLR
jgi:hypothetical protein